MAPCVREHLEPHGTPPMTCSQPLCDARAEGVLARLHRAADSQRFGVAVRFMSQAPSFLLGRGVRFLPGALGIFDEKFIAIGPQQGRLLYLLARSIGARHIVEFGTSFGVSTIYLACAVRDNGGGRVVGTELLPSKAARARSHLEEAGVSEWVDVRVGDARQTLRDLDAPIDLALLDGFPHVALDVLSVIEPRLRPGAVVVADDVLLFKKDLAPLIEHLSDPKRGYRATTFPLEDGMLVAVRSSTNLPCRSGSMPAAGQGLEPS